MQTTSPTRTDGAAIARSLGLLYLAGPAVGYIWLLLPHSRDANELGVVATSLAAQLVGGLLLTARGRRLPAVAYQLIVAAAPVFVSISYIFSGSSTSGFAFFYLWVTPYAFVFFRPRHAMLQLAWVGLCSAASLALLSSGATGGVPQSSEEAGRWLIGMATLAIVGVLARDLTIWLRESDTRFRRGFNDALVGMALVGLDCRWQSVNPALSRILEQSNAQLEGRPIAASTHPDDNDAWAIAAELAVNGGPSAFTLELRLLLRDARTVWARVNASLVTNDRGAPLYFTAQIEDITARKHEEDRLHRELKGVAWIGRLREALDRDQLVLHAQPIVDIHSGELVQEELLLRMVGPHGELIAPGLFLPAAEHYGLIEEVDRWVVRRAARLAASGRRVQVNLSARSISHRDLPTEVEAELRRAGSDPGLMTFEITETAVIDDLQHARSFATRMEALGCGFALDDFGTGYGSFTSLKNLPVSYLKIDMEFVQGLTRDGANREVVKAIVGLAQGLGQRTIAEGVEDEETLELLRACGVDYAQGYLLGRPVPVEFELDEPGYGRRATSAVRW
jgi:PAS domain S-box-containing protein